MRKDGCNCRCRGCQGTSKGMQLFNGHSIYGPWMRRRGDYARMTADVIKVRGGVNLVVRLMTKNPEALGDGVEIDSARTITTEVTGRTMQEWGPSGIGIQMLVRFEYSCNVVTSPGWVRFRMLKGCWFDAAGPGAGE